MKVFTAILSIILIASAAYAQSGRGSQTNGGKTNARPSVTPTPKPSPSTEVETGELGEVDGPEILVDTKLVTIPVRVIDRKGRFIGGLKKENFKVFEDNAEQEVALFSNDAQAFTVALVLDMSYSAKFKAEEIQNAAIEFIDQLRPDDRVIVISFDAEVHIHCEPTSDRKEIYRAIRQTVVSTGTSLYEAVDTTINARLRKIEGRKAMVLFTDGVDTTSRRKHDRDNLDDVREIDTIVYPIRYDTYADVQRIKNTPQLPMPTQTGTSSRVPGGSTPPIIPSGGSGNPFPFPMPTGTIGTRTRPNTTPTTRQDPNDPRMGQPDPRSVGMGIPDGTTIEEYRKGEEYLNQLADLSGGRIYVADTLGNLSGAFSKIASELREFYSLSYYPSADATPGKTRKIKVKVDQPNVAVKARDSYVVADKEGSR